MEANCIILVYLKCRWQLLFIVLLLLIYFSNYRKLSHTHYFHSTALFLPILRFSNGNLTAGMFRHRIQKQKWIAFAGTESLCVGFCKNQLHRLSPRDSLLLGKQVGRYRISQTWEPAKQQSILQYPQPKQYMQHNNS